MGRTIDADKLKAYLQDKYVMYDHTLADIDAQPTVDAEPVVRCKDCKYFDHSDFGKGEECWCKHFVSTDDYTHCHKVMEDDFCAWGERKENAD